MKGSIPPAPGASSSLINGVVCVMISGVLSDKNELPTKLTRSASKGRVSE
jgi:hypothetical protein